MKTMDPARFRLLCGIAGFLLCVLLAFFVRTHRYNHERERLTREIGGDFIPFTIESSIMYAYAQDVAAGRGIPAHDPGLIGMEEYRVADQMTLGLEYFLGYGYRIRNWLQGLAGIKPSPPNEFEENPDFSRHLRVQIRLWTSLTTGFVFLWLFVMRCPWGFALAGGLLHAFAPAAIARYTGQDLIRGQFALPILTAVFLVGYWSLRRPAWWKSLLLGATVFLALATWDMSQICLGLWAVVEAFRAFLGGNTGKKRLHFWVVVFAAAVLAGIFIPYHRTHQLLLSPLVLVLLPLNIVLNLRATPLGFSWKRIALGSLAFVVLVATWRFASSLGTFAGNYRHFAELLVAKIRFLNVKPADPALLSFDARVLWTPAMHSARWADIPVYFPGALFGLMLALPTGLLSRKFRESFRRGLGRSFVPLVMCIIYFIGFIFIFRYHVFCILFLCVAFPMLLSDWARAFRGTTAKTALLCVAALVVMAEATTTFRLERAYVVDSYMRETGGLIKWFRRDGAPGTAVLADFCLSPVLKSYGGAKIMLQPQYELDKNRRNYETFIRILYHGTEPELNRYCVENGIELFVFDRGYGPLAPMHIYSPRYFAAARDIVRTAPVFSFYFTPDKHRWFYRIEPPEDLRYLERKYQIFKVIRPKDRIAAMKTGFAAEMALAAGNRDEAKRLARDAFRLDPNSEQTYELYARLWDTIPRLRLNEAGNVVP